MKKNIGNNRTLRVILALAIGALYFQGVIDGSAATILGVLAAVFAVTSFVSWCPLYLPFGLSTRKEA